MAWQAALLPALRDEPEGVPPPGHRRLPEQDGAQLASRNGSQGLRAFVDMAFLSAYARYLKIAQRGSTAILKRAAAIRHPSETRAHVRFSAREFALTAMVPLRPRLLTRLPRVK